MTRPIATSIERGRIVLDLQAVGPPEEKRGSGRCFDSLVQTLDVALRAYREDRFSIVERLREHIAVVLHKNARSR